MGIFWILGAIAVLGLIYQMFLILAVRSTLKKTGSKQYAVCSGEKADNKEAVNCSLPATQTEDLFTPISILKPLKGMDGNLFDNIESFCNLDYPEYEIIFAIQDYDDPAYNVVLSVKNKHPEKNISIIVKNCNIGLNPKVNNLISAYNVSRYQHILISDSNVMVSKDYLKEVAGHIRDPDVGLVSNLIRGTGGRTIGSLFENIHMNSFVVGGVCFLDRFLKMPCAVGKSMLMRKRDLEVIGGLEAVKDFLAEDYIMGKEMHKLGKKVVLSNYIIDNVNTSWGISRFLSRHTRWGKLRWKICGVKYFSEPISNPVFVSFLLILILEPTKITMFFALFVCFAKSISDFYIGKKIGFKINPLLYLLSPAKDLFLGVIWFIPILSNTVVWRGNRYIIKKNSALAPYPERDEMGARLLRHRLFEKIFARHNQRR
ncbi:ceramide glucosyltransferase [Thermodesulfovibrionales bacterium]|nr:ceramide glucosyltransferase [Thermodesulfovibrionales bacterium]